MSTIEQAQTPEYADVDLEQARQTAETLSSAVKRSVHPLPGEETQFPQAETMPIWDHHPFANPQVPPEDRARVHSISHVPVTMKGIDRDAPHKYPDQERRDRKRIAEDKEKALKARGYIDDREAESLRKKGVYSHPEHLDLDPARSGNHYTDYNLIKSLKQEVLDNLLQALPPEEAANYLRVELMYREAFEEQLLDRIVRAEGRFDKHGVYSDALQHIPVPKRSSVALESPTGDSRASYDFPYYMVSGKSPTVTRHDTSPKGRKNPEPYTHTFRPDGNGPNGVRRLIGRQAQQVEQATRARNLEGAQERLAELRSPQPIEPVA